MVEARQLFHLLTDVIHLLTLQFRSGYHAKQDGTREGDHVLRQGSVSKIRWQSVPGECMQCAVASACSVQCAVIDRECMQCAVCSD
jgi:hypothetical protein